MSATHYHSKTIKRKFYSTQLLAFSSLFFSYLVRPSPFSAQKTFERHNSRRKSNISFCSNINLGAACGPQVGAVGVNANTGAGSRRGSGMGLNPMQMQSVQTLAGYASPRCTPPIQQIKSNSLSLPDSPTVVGSQRGRSNSLRVGYTSNFSFFFIFTNSYSFLFFKRLTSKNKKNQKNIRNNFYPIDYPFFSLRFVCVVLLSFCCLTTIP